MGWQGQAVQHAPAVRQKGPFSTQVGQPGHFQFVASLRQSDLTLKVLPVRLSLPAARLYGMLFEGQAGKVPRTPFELLAAAVLGLEIARNKDAEGIAPACVLIAVAVTPTYPREFKHAYPQDTDSRPVASREKSDVAPYSVLCAMLTSGAGGTTTDPAGQTFIARKPQRKLQQPGHAATCRHRGIAGRAERDDPVLFLIIFHGFYCTPFHNATQGVILRQFTTMKKLGTNWTIIPE